KPATPRLVQRKAIDKRRATGYAGKFSRQRFRFRQASPANRHADQLHRSCCEGFAANAALIGEDQVQQTRAYPSQRVQRAGGHCKSGWQQATTREDPPPPTYEL